MNVWILLSLQVILISICTGIKPDDRPTLPKLLKFKLPDKKTNIITRVASDYTLFGTLLLNDEDGTIVEIIKQSKMHDSVEITMQIFRQWLRLYSADSAPSWQMLVHVLRQCNLNTVANDIESMYGVVNDEDIQTKKPTSLTNNELSTNPSELHPIYSFKELNKAVSEIGNWYGLCSNLDVERGLLSELQHSNEHISIKKTQCLEAYYDQGEATWERLITAINDYPIRNRRVAKELADKHGIDFKNLIKDEL